MMERRDVLKGGLALAMAPIVGWSQPSTLKGVFIAAEEPALPPYRVMAQGADEGLNQITMAAVAELRRRMTTDFSVRALHYGYASAMYYLQEVGQKETDDELTVWLRTFEQPTPADTLHRLVLPVMPLWGELLFDWGRTRSRSRIGRKLSTFSLTFTEHEYVPEEMVTSVATDGWIALQAVRHHHYLELEASVRLDP